MRGCKNPFKMWWSLMQEEEMNWVKWRNEAHKLGEPLGEHMRKWMESKRKFFANYRTKHNDADGLGGVVEALEELSGDPAGWFEVNLRTMSCVCGVPQRDHKPCSHYCFFIDDMGKWKDRHEFVHACWHRITHRSQYELASFESVREDDIANVIQEEEWSDLEFAPLMYNPKGRPSVQRVKGILERGKQGGRGARGTQVCEDCWYGGHEMRNPICPQYDARMLADARQDEEQPPPPNPDPQ
mmetsp:Transcript_30145/g.47260  ORF Transcript_30145/g.47260 Transcript_30145/m.47260 type:complete len:241 (+) Transcript_30145:1233-1955(+)